MLTTNPCACAHGDLTGRHGPLFEKMDQKTFSDCCLPLDDPNDPKAARIIVLKDLPPDYIKEDPKSHPVIACFRLGGSLQIAAAGSFHPRWASALSATVALSTYLLR